MKNKEELLTVTEVADEFRISEETVRRWMRSGHLPFVPVGPFRLKRIRRGDIVRDANTNQLVDETDEPVAVKKNG